MLLLLALLGCSEDPEPIAIRACESVPTISIHEGDLDAYRGLLSPADIRVLSEAEPTRGLMEVGSEGLAAMREAATCTIKDVREVGEGQWEVRLERTIAAEATGGVLDEDLEQELNWTVVSTPQGLRVDTGLQRMASMRASAAQERGQENYRRVLELWKTIYGMHGDPTLVHDIAEAEEVAEMQAYRVKLLRPLDKARDESTNELVIPLQNTGPKDVKKAVVELVYLVGDEEISEQVEVGPIKSTERVEVRAPYPDEEEVKYRGLRILKVVL